MATGLIVAASGWDGVMRLHAPTTAERSLAEISVTGYSQSGEDDETSPGESYSSAIYIGPALTNLSVASR
jgi:hypothetical protein